MSGAVIIRRAEPPRSVACVTNVGRLPAYFTPSTHEQVETGIRQGQGWVGFDGQRVVGFVMVERRYDQAAEITVAAVDPNAAMKASARNWWTTS